MNVRQTKMIGMNIRHGFTPGGFTGSTNNKGGGKPGKKASMAKVQAAANIFLAERGLDHPPSSEFLFGAKRPQ